MPVPDTWNPFGAAGEHHVTKGHTTSLYPLAIKYSTEGSLGNLLCPDAFKLKLMPTRYSNVLPILVVLLVFGSKLFQYWNTATTVCLNMARKRPVKRLISEYTPGSGKAQVLEKPSQLVHVLWVASRGNQGIRNVAIMWMLFGSGMRVNEVAQLKVSDVYHKESRELKQSFVIPGAYTKTGNSRLAYILTKGQIAAIKAWERQRLKDAAFVDVYHGKTVLAYNSPLFLSRFGKKWRKLSFNEKKYKSKSGEVKSTLVCSSLENLVRGILKSAGIQAGSSHSGRRTLATLMDRKGFDLELIQRILAHESPDMTLEYIDVNMVEIENALEKTLGNIELPKYELNCEK